MVKYFGTDVLLMPANEPWSTLQAALEQFEPGFQIEREQPLAQEREFARVEGLRLENWVQAT